MQCCPHCMSPTTEPICPNCGGDVSWTGQKGVDLPVGTVLSGGNGLRTYQIGAARGKGGFGITYVALEVNSNRRMAVKEYYPTRCAFRGGNGVDVRIMTGQESIFRSGMNSFLTEGKMLLAQDDLPSVVHVIDYFQANGTAYLAMEYLDGVPLHAQMARMGGRIPVSEMMPRLAPLLRDLGQLHRRGVIHRDISPDNIMWMPDGVLKLLDFGSARSMENGKSMTVLMKQGFSPVEQHRTTGQGPYTDIYALSATICYCVTGVIPPDSMERLAGDTLQSPIALGAELTPTQEAALLWALSIRPEARPQNMEEFAGLLFKEEPEPRPGPEPEKERTPVRLEKDQPEPGPEPGAQPVPQPEQGPEPVQPGPGPATQPEKRAGARPPQVGKGKMVAVIILTAGLGIYVQAALSYSMNSFDYSIQWDGYWSTEFIHEGMIFLFLAMCAAACAVCSILMLTLNRKKVPYLLSLISIVAGFVITMFALVTGYYSYSIAWISALLAAGVAIPILTVYWRSWRKALNAAGGGSA